jgi:hypothetical protein
MIQFIGASYTHCVLSCGFVSGILDLASKTLIGSFPNIQDTVKTTVFVSMFFSENPDVRDDELVLRSSIYQREELRDDTCFVTDSRNFNVLVTTKRGVTNFENVIKDFRDAWCVPSYYIYFEGNHSRAPLCPLSAERGVTISKEDWRASILAPIIR